ncbi:hypothetical protein GN956_G7834 [Arapaima gigas]
MEKSQPWSRSGQVLHVPSHVGLEGAVFGPLHTALRRKLSAPTCALARSPANQFQGVQTSVGKAAVVFSAGLDPLPTRFGPVLRTRFGPPQE